MFSLLLFSLFSDTPKFGNYLQLCKIEWMNGGNKEVNVIVAGLKFF